MLLAGSKCSKISCLLYLLATLHLLSFQKSRSLVLGMKHFFSRNRLCASRIQSAVVRSTNFYYTSSHSSRTWSWKLPANQQDWTEDPEHTQQVNHLKGGQLSDYWIKELSKVQRESARRLLSQLKPDNPLGFDAPESLRQPGKLFSDFVENRKTHPEKVVLMRVGDFYETYGADAVMLVEHAGLNPMAGKAKAGCPKQNVQQTLDALTGAGLTVAVYEELEDPGVGHGPRTRRRKQRALGGVVSPGAQTYLYNLNLCATDIPFRDARPYAGVASTAQGYTFCEVRVDERCIYLSERLTPEACQALLEAARPAEPVFAMGPLGEGGRALLRHVETVEIPFTSNAVQAIENYVRGHHGLGTDEKAMEPFRQVKANRDGGRPLPLYTSTLREIGLLPNPHVPQLVPALLGARPPAHAARFFERWLRDPPAPADADAMAALLAALLDPKCPPPPDLSRPVPVGKVVQLLQSGQANPALFLDLRDELHGVLQMLTNPGHAAAAGPLARLVARESGLGVDPAALRGHLGAALREIEAVVAVGDAATPDPGSEDPLGNVPEGFFGTNEQPFRGVVAGGVLEEIYRAVDESASSFVQAVSEDFFPPSEITFDRFNNVVLLKKRPKQNLEGADLTNDENDQYFHPKDRNGKVLTNRWSTAKVQEAQNRYLDATTQATNGVRAALQRLCAALAGPGGGGHLPALVQASHWAALLSAALHHAREGRRRGWTLPHLRRPPGKGAGGDGASEGGAVGQEKTAAEEEEEEEEGMLLQLGGLVPYWLPSPGRPDPVPNDLHLPQLMLLTAPNAAGKSTLMRAALAAALLGNAGLLVPCARAKLPRYDLFALRTASHDLPAEERSAFAQEMADVAALLRDAGPRSLAMVDEVGKGTSSRDGAAVAGALLEALSRRRTRGIFSTHLHEVFDLPLKLEGVVYKRMGTKETGGKDDGYPDWSYKLEDGRCRASLADVTAARAGLPPDVVARMRELQRAADGGGRGGGGGGGGSGPAAAAAGSLGAESNSMGARQGAKGSGGGGGAEEVGVQGAQFLRQRRNGAVVGAGTGGRWVGVADAMMENLLSLVEETTGTSHVRGDIIVIDQGQTTPAFLENQACLYVLIDDRWQAYVGESARVARRLGEHAAAPPRRGALRLGPWRRALVVPLGSPSAGGVGAGDAGGGGGAGGGKGRALELEAALVGRLVERGHAVMNARLTA